MVKIKFSENKYLLLKLTNLEDNSIGTSTSIFNTHGCLVKLQVMSTTSRYIIYLYKNLGLFIANELSTLLYMIPIDNIF
ncbi:hypothetical protein EUGRSUZ_D00639 [Eucalyptus grandis]|uniref:Uncharacterized protein n=2 Tax=Eucalyptus grandis TaxID=71139 RepID=A0ACC3L3P7_EUCGR|nr:hypothetical protein EUGRSUZ_D00639 [Eucalyptus grandis]